MTSQKRLFNLLMISAVVCLAWAITFVGTTANGRTIRSRAVYVLTNQTVNAVAAFERNADGPLTPAGTSLTGGGNPVPQPGDPPTDPLASHGAHDRIQCAGVGNRDLSELSPSLA